jgi:hypothetical protein
MLECSITCDIDTLASIYKGYGLRRPGGYTYAELRMGLENFSRFLEPFGIKATLFMVGKDFEPPQNMACIRDIFEQGHEIANHTYTHAQGFRLLNAEEKRSEIETMEKICLRAIGCRPLGFRAPGWNVSDDALPILKKRGYIYDSSVFPSSINPLMKLAHWQTMKRRTGGDRTTLGTLNYMFAPTQPYVTDRSGFGRRGRNGIVEFPITVVPGVRLPFFATFLLATGLEFFKRCYRILKARGASIQYQFHLSDFVDYEHPELKDQVPVEKGVYVPQALNTSLQRKWDIFCRALGIIASDYGFSTLKNWAYRLLN